MSNVEYDYEVDTELIRSEGRIRPIAVTVYVTEVIQTTSLNTVTTERTIIATSRTPLPSDPDPTPCCCNWGGAIGNRHGIPSGEEPEFDCADCPKHGGQQDKYRCKRHRAGAST